jgi:cytochrome oxidase Cu insertion factor (SCO1/SenC/PrrC family)
MHNRWRTAIAWSGVAAAVVAGVVFSWPRNHAKKPTGPPAAKPELSGAVTGDEPATIAADLPILGVLPEFNLTDQRGAASGLRQLRDKVWIGNFVFTRCQATCPRQTAELTKLQEKLRKHAAWDDIRLVSISVDPEHDTPEVLANYARTAEADPEHWKFLTGSREKIWELSRNGFKLPVGENPKNADMPLFHSPKFVLVDFYGRIRGFHDGLSAEGIAELSRDIDRVFAERLPIPEEILRPGWMENRKKIQLATAAQFQTFHGFQFEDRVAESGITYRNKVVDDAAKSYKPAHYDHGTGLSIADVDGDGRCDVYFVNQAGSNELWKNSGGGRFENVTEAAGVALAGRISVAASFADIDHDGDADLFVTTVRHGNALFANDGHGRFSDITEESGLAYSGHSSGAVFFDFNRDGLVDLFLTNVGKYTNDQIRTVTGETIRGELPTAITYYESFADAFAGHLKEERNERSQLYKNLGQNRFVDISETMDLIDNCWSGDASPLDVNNDGWPDLYVLNMQGHNQYYENVEGARFERKSRDVFPNTPWGAMGIKVFDFDNDGRMDIFVTDMHSDMAGRIGLPEEKFKSIVSWPDRAVQSGKFNPQPGRQSIYGNAFFRNDGDGRFSEISDLIGAENLWPWGLSVGDLNADGFDDVFITASMNYPYRYGVNSLLLNERGERFRDSEFILGVEPRRNGRTATPWFELDCDGKDRDHRLCEEKKLKGRHVVWSALGSRSSAIFDIDDDGDLDIVTNEFNSEPMVLVSNLSEKNPNLHFLKVKLTGKQSNRDGLGATVTVRAAGRSFCKVYDGLSGYLGHSLYPLYFGLGEAGTVESIEVTWPSGTHQVVAGPLEINRVVEISEP